jgi:hypothetical protein
VDGTAVTVRKRSGAFGNLLIMTVTVRTNRLTEPITYRLFYRRR